MWSYFQFVYCVSILMRMAFWMNGLRLIWVTFTVLVTSVAIATWFISIFRCECPSGRTGDLCDLYTDLCLSNPCLNGAFCHHEVDRYRCECPSAYAGVNCEFQIDPCDPNPCFYGGKCQQNSTVANGYTCSCAKGFLGLRCEAKVYECASGPCKNSGTCVENISEPGYVCQCGEIYTGQFCEVKKDGCMISACYNGGQCVPSGGSEYITPFLTVMHLIHLVKEPVRF